LRITGNIKGILVLDEKERIARNYFSKIRDSTMTTIDVSSCPETTEILRFITNTQEKELHSINEKIIELLGEFQNCSEIQKNFILETILKSQAWCTPTNPLGKFQKTGLMQSPDLFMYERVDITPVEVENLFSNFSNNVMPLIYKSLNGVFFSVAMIGKIKRILVVINNLESLARYYLEAFINYHCITYNDFYELSEMEKKDYDGILLIEDKKTNLSAYISENISKLLCYKSVIFFINNINQTSYFYEYYNNFENLYIVTKVESKKKYRMAYGFLFTKMEYSPSNVELIYFRTLGFNISYSDHLSLKLPDFNKINIHQNAKMKYSDRNDLNQNLVKGGVEKTYSDFYKQVLDLINSCGYNISENLLIEYVVLVRNKIHENLQLIKESNDHKTLSNVIEEFRTLLNHTFYIKSLESDAESHTRVTLNLEENLNNIINRDLFENKHDSVTLTFSSDMAAMNSILSQLMGIKGKIIVFSGVYWEIRTLLFYYFNPDDIEYFSTNKEFIEKMEKNIYNIVFVDPFFTSLYDNYQKTPTINFKKLIKDLHTFPSISHVIMDITCCETSFFRNHEKLVLSKDKTYYIHQSLQKMFQYGEDMSSGGSVTVIYNSDKERGYKELKRFRAGMGVDLEPTSALILNFWVKNSEYLSSRNRNIVQSTQTIVHEMNDWLRDNSFSSVKIIYSQGTPIFCIEIEGDCEEFRIQLENKLEMFNVPLFFRGSFGFNELSATIFKLDCGSEIIRIAPGLHTKDELKSILISIKECIRYYVSNIKYFLRIKNIKLKMRTKD
jgi:cystathionine beta-lyase/cystathionine gamma-synthase